LNNNYEIQTKVLQEFKFKFLAI